MGYGIAYAELDKAGTVFSLGQLPYRKAMQGFSSAENALREARTGHFLDPAIRL
jgi:hypothetical protein